MKKELLRFLVIGCTAVLIDLLVYSLLSTFMVSYIAKTISFLAGSLASYFFNKFWTFEAGENKNKDWIKFSILYLSTLCVNVLINAVVLKYTNIYILAFLFATGTSTVLNFIGMKWWVFKK